MRKRVRMQRIAMDDSTVNKARQSSGNIVGAKGTPLSPQTFLKLQRTIGADSTGATLTTIQRLQASDTVKAWGEKHIGAQDQARQEAEEVYQAQQEAEAQERQSFMKAEAARSRGFDVMTGRSLIQAARQPFEAAVALAPTLLTLEAQATNGQEMNNGPAAAYSAVIAQFLDAGMTLLEQGLVLCGRMLPGMPPGGSITPDGEKLDEGRWADLRLQIIQVKSLLRSGAPGLARQVLAMLTVILATFSLAQEEDRNADEEARIRELVERAQKDAQGPGAPQ